VGTAAFVMAALEYPNLQSGARQISRQAQTVMARTDYHCVV
jgi:hypothetical protein